MLKIGHRGAAGYEPENTLISFKKSLELKVDMIELDVHVCKTGQVIVMHDCNINKTTNGQGYIRNLSFEDLRKLNVGKGQQIPLLTEIIDLVNKKVPINIELKGLNTANKVNDIIESYVKKGWKYNNFIISSFNHKELKKFYKLNKKVKLGILIDNNWFKLNFWIFSFAKRINANSINISLKLSNKKLINKIHKNNLQVFVYTVNKKADIIKMKKLKVDGIFSDYPDKS